MTLAEPIPTMTVSQWAGQRVALLTRHQKLDLIAPALASVGLDLLLTDAFDTDTLGSFAGDIRRTLSPVACARQKAQLAAELTGCRFGLGSEGSFGGGPLPGLVNWDEEILVLHDSLTNIDIVASAAGPVPLTSIELSDLSELSAKLAKFPLTQGWMLHLNGQWHKGLVGADAIQSTLIKEGIKEGITQGISIQPNTKIELTPDLRAMHCPPRQDYIRRAAEQLAQRLQAACPRCDSANFWQTVAEYGLPCMACGTPTSQLKTVIKCCQVCGHQEHTAVVDAFAEPEHCPVCNP